MNRTSRIPILVIALILLVSAAATTVPAAPVAVGASQLIGTLDYSDTFTTTLPRNNTATFADYGVGSAALAVENSYGNPSVFWSETNDWAAAGVSNAFHDSATNVKVTDPNPMADSGVLEGPPVLPNVHGEEAAVFPYGSLRDRFVLQFDAVLVGDRMNIRFFNTGQSPSATGGGGITFFIRADSYPFAPPKISLFKPGEIDTGLTTGITDTTQWNNYAFDVNIPANTIELYVNELSRGVINLATIDGGAFSTRITGANISLSAAHRADPSLFDNFQIGARIPEPSSAVLTVMLATICCGLSKRTCRRA